MRCLGTIDNVAIVVPFEVQYVKFIGHHYKVLRRAKKREQCVTNYSVEVMVAKSL